MLKRLDLRGRDHLAEYLSEFVGQPTASAGDGGPATPDAQQVRELLDAVRTGGDAAVAQLTQRFDNVTVERPRAEPDATAVAWGALDAHLRDALALAHRRIVAYHRHEAPEAFTYDEHGVSVESRLVPVERVGLYVPGGLAAYPSTVLMTAVPARCAGVSEVALFSPPGANGQVNSLVLSAAEVAGVDEVYAIGGVQAVAAMTYGTETIKPVDVIAGPGNAWVSAAQREVAASGVVGVVTAHAGPSEIALIVDGTCPPDYAAVDLVLQAEHGPDGRAWLITFDEPTAAAVVEAVDATLARSERADVTRRTLADGGYVVLVDDEAAALEVADAFAPEHLQLMCADARALASKVRNAGAVFVGPHSPASVGDYVAGPSHVLPTGRSARFAGALGVEAFTKRVATIEVTDGAAGELIDAVGTLARAEGLCAHAASIEVRQWR